jgi:SAM-dependent methyltransferase
LIKRRADCRLCGSTEVELVFSLTPTPPANAFVPREMLQVRQEVFPLDLFFCGKCTHLQLLDVVDPSELFRDYVYVSGTSPVFVEHFEKYAAWAMKSLVLRRNDFVVDIGSNDGTLLRFFKEAGLRVQGVDPALNIAAKATAAGVPTIPEFFTPELARGLRHAQGPAMLVTANNVFAHADDLRSVVEGARELLAPEGVFVFEVSYLGDVIEKNLFDTIYHEHLSYHAVAPLAAFFKANGMELIDAARVDSHGGSLRGTAKLAAGKRPVASSVKEFIKRERELGLDKAETYRAFFTRIESVKKQLTALLDERRAQGKRIAGFGAPAKATTLMYHFGLGPKVIEFIVDDSPLKQGLFTPGLHVPVLPSSALNEWKPDELLILAWNFAPSIMKKLPSYRGRFIVPLPKVERC